MAVSSRINNGVATITISGRFDFGIHSEFKTGTEAIFAQKDVKSLEVNMSQVDYVDSSALGILLVLRDRALAAGIKDMSLIGAKGLVKQILEVAHFEKFFTLR